MKVAAGELDPVDDIAAILETAPSLVSDIP